MPQRSAVRAVAIFAGRRPDAYFRHHGFGEPRAWFAVHGGRVLRRHVRGIDGKFCRRGAARACRDAFGRYGSGGDRATSALWSRPSRPRARHLWADPVLQRAGAHRLGTGGAEPAAAILVADRGRDRAWFVLSDLP